jgi:methyltransferase (TIGR00027 family)
MNEASASQTALMVAGLRARATRSTRAICSDPWAARLAGPDGEALAKRFLDASPFMELWIAVRTALFDSLVARTTGDVRQAVLLGAGLDTRAARFEAPTLRFFEVDRPSSQAAKLERLRALGDYPIDAATYVPCDFEREDFLDRLVASGFRRAEPTLFIWEGVACYLSEAAVRRTLGRIASGCDPSSVVAFDYVGKKLAQGRATDEPSRATVDLVAALAEPLAWGTNDVLPLLFEEGFRHVRTISFDEACLRLTGTYDRRRLFRFQHVAVASVGAEASI